MQAWCESKHVDLKASTRPKQVKPHERAAQGVLKGLRLIVETVFGMLADQFRMETTRARSGWGVSVRMVAKVAALNLSAWLNEQYERPRLAIKSLFL